MCEYIWSFAAIGEKSFSERGTRKRAFLPCFLLTTFCDTSEEGGSALQWSLVRYWAPTAHSAGLLGDRPRAPKKLSHMLGRARSAFNESCLIVQNRHCN